MRRLRNKKGQSALEYALLISGVIAAVLVFSPYVQKAVQGRFKESSDRIGRPFDPSKGNVEIGWREKGEGTVTKTIEHSGTFAAALPTGAPTLPSGVTSAAGDTITYTSQSEKITRDTEDSWGDAKDLPTDLDFTIP